MTALVEPIAPTAPTAAAVGGTELPRRDQNVLPTPRANLGRLPVEERFVTWGARVAALALAWVIVERILPVHGLAWFLFVAAVANVALLAVGTAVIGSTVAVADRVVQWLVSTAMVVVVAAVGSVVVYVLAKGWPALRHINFYTHDMTGVGANDPLNRGGILHAIVGSLIELTIASLIALPLGVGTAVFMNEIGGRFAKIVRTVVEAMTALPDILAGLFIYTVWIIVLGFPRSGLAAALAITVMMLPIIARASDVVLRVVPGTLREASLALGASRWSTVWNVVLPTARPGLATALILAIARGIGETAPVMITSGNATFLHLNPAGGMMTSLPLFIFTSARSGIDIQIQRGFGTAAVLLALVLILFILARLVARPSSNKPSLSRLLKRVLRLNTLTQSAGYDVVAADPLSEIGPIAPPQERTTAHPVSHYPPAPDEEVP
ncbi:phosphate ABC transporter permease PstA [Nocardioides sp. Iso805N]|uniref:phosphate ABC transporter permease PstA n=1 Tax=Nocardioides sp. Iso805N TaxID=1283287 RepID=UPI00037F865E|nr:phosphate ABC transporter permease PstA [Nocardioides sp. Iso805N]